MAEVAGTITVPTDAYDTWLRLIDSLDGYRVRVHVNDGTIIENCEIHKDEVLAFAPDRSIPAMTIERIHVY